MTDERFIKKFVERFEFSLEDMAEEIRETDQKETPRIIYRCYQKNFERVLRLLKEINAASKKVVVTVYSAKDYEFLVERKYCQS